MKQENNSKTVAIVMAGDVAVLGLVTVLGFMSHESLAAGTRMLTTYLPLVVAWFLIAPHLGVYSLETICQPSQLWRPFWSMVLAGPLAAWLRGVWLNAPVQIIFVVIIGGVSALGLGLWRAIWLVFRLGSERGWMKLP